MIRLAVSYQPESVVVHAVKAQTCEGEPTTLAGGSTGGRVEQVVHKLDCHPGTLHDEEAARSPRPQRCFLFPSCRERGAVVADHNRTTGQDGDAVLRQVDGEVGEARSLPNARIFASTAGL